jgi:hypothetical protein
MQFNITSILILLFLTFNVIEGFSQSNDWNENEHADFIQALIGGEREHSVESGRIDLLTDEYAFEIEWANKWKDAIGQAIWYGLQTNKKPGIILLLKSKENYKYYIQLNSALTYANLNERIVVFLYPNDFEELIEANRNND